MSTPSRSSAPSSSEPDVLGSLRDCTPAGKGRKKSRPGDIAVVNSADLSRSEAQALIDAEPAAVVNAARFSTGAVPNYGPLMLLDANIMLFEAAGADIFSQFRDGTKKGGLNKNGAVFVGTKEIARAEPVSRQHAEDMFGRAQQSLVEHMEEYFGDSITFIHSEAPLLIDGLGIPDIDGDFAGKKVLVVSPSAQLRGHMGQLRNFIREFSPVIVGVDGAADTLVDMGYAPDYIVGDPAGVSSEALRSGARVILPADPEGNAVGLERIQELGIGAMTFPTATDSSTDLALLLAGYHDAELVVNVSPAVDLDAIFADADHTSPAAMLTRLKLGPRLVNSSAIINLYKVNSGGSLAWLWAIFGILVAVAAIVLVVGLGGDDSFVNNLINTWNGIALTVQGWFQ